MRILLIICIIFSACGKETKPIEVKSISTADFKKLEKIEENLVEYRLSKDTKILSTSKFEVSDYLSNKIINKEFSSRLWALKAEIAYLENNQNEFEKSLKNIKEKIPQSYILKSWIEKNEEKKLSLLLEGEKEFEKNPRIELEIGLLYFDRSEYSKAYAYLDDALSKLPYTYKNLYGEKLEKASKFKNLDKNTQKKWILIESLTLEDVLNIINSETSLLKVFNIQKIDSKAIKPLVDEKIIPEGAFLNKQIEKKEVIYIIFKLLEKNNYKDIATFYRKFPEKYKTNSPIKDVNVDDFFYEASIYFVQKGIIELPDGKNLYPSEKISGNSFHEIIEKIKRIK
ncbi:MAG: hypothetical protein ACP5Q5_08230 [Brevinematia bacterium]